MSERQTKAGNLANLIARSLDRLINLSISHSLTLDMLNKFCFDLYAQKSLFIAENCMIARSLDCLIT